MNKKSKEKIPSVFQIFRRSQDPSYPQLLVKFLSAEDVIGFELEKAEYLLSIWTEEYSRMPQIGKSTYYNVIPKVQKHLYSIYAQKKKGMESIATLYFLTYKKWHEITAHVQKGLKQSDHETLILFWSISFRMIKNIQLIQRQEFGQFLADQFQQSLSMFKWKCHAEKIYILQIIKYINNDIQYKPFVKNGEKWTQIIKTMKQEPFVSEIVKTKGQMHLEVFKYEYEQIKINKQKIASATNANDLKKKKFERKIPLTRDENPLQKQKQKQKQNQYLSREEIHMFLVVKDELQEQEIYRIELLSEIIGCRPLMFLICQEYWESLTYQVILQIEQKIETLNIEVRTDMLLSKMFLGLLKYQKTSHIIRERIGEEIVVKIIKNIELYNKKSPFETQQFSQIPTLVNESFFYISPQMKAMKITVESIVNKRVKSILEQGNMGKDDIINRSLMTVSCREELILKLPILRDIKQFLITVKKKKVVKIETCIILIKILLSASKSPQFNQLNAFILAMSLTHLSQLFGVNQKVNQLRKLNIQLLNILIPIIAVNEDISQQQYGLLIDETLKWLEVVQLNFTIVFAPMINILILFINRYKQYFLSQERTMEYLERILSGLMEKLGHQHNTENMFAFLDCLLKAYVKFEWSPGQSIYDQVPSQSFIDWQILYRKQAKILFKKEEQIKWNAKLEEQKAKKQKQLKWSSLLKRKQTISSSTNFLERKSSLNQDQTNDMSTSQIVEFPEQKKCEQKMAIYFGSAQINWLKQLIKNHEIWTNEALIKSQLGCLEYSLIQTIASAQKQYYLKNDRPNEFMKRIISSLDDDMYDLFNFLIEVESYQSLFLFASQIYFTCRDFPFVSQLRSYQLLLNKCFSILSVFFNKVQILYASSTFCSLLLPYANHRDLKLVYEQLNKQEFLTDLFKGSNEFIGKEKCYYPWLIKILMAYEITEQFRQKNRLVKESLQILGKNVVWWGNVLYLINAEIDVEDHEVKESKILIFDIFKEQYRKIINDYFSRVQKTIEVGIKRRQLMMSK